jgi:hypothetical protein
MSVKDLDGIFYDIWRLHVGNQVSHGTIIFRIQHCYYTECVL